MRKINILLDFKSIKRLCGHVLTDEVTEAWHLLPVEWLGARQ